MAQKHSGHVIDNDGRMTFFDCIPCMVALGFMVLICIALIWGIIRSVR